MTATNTPPTRYTVTEKFQADQAAVWTARVGRSVAVKVVSPQEHGMWDTDLLRKALAEHAGVSVEHVRPRRTLNDRGVAPRVWEVDAPQAEEPKSLAERLELTDDRTETVRARFEDTMDNITRSNNTSSLADMVRYAAELWRVLLARKATGNAPTEFVELMAQAALHTKIVELGELGRQAGRMWQERAQRLAAPAEEAAPVEVEEGEYRMFVGILREAARDMGTYQAANVRESVRQNDEQGRGVERLEDGTIRAGYSWFVKAPVAEEAPESRPCEGCGVDAGDPCAPMCSAEVAEPRHMVAPVAESPEEEVTPTAHTVYVVALASPVRGSSMAGQEVRTDYVREAIRTAARVEVKAVRIGNEGIIRVGSLMFIPQRLASV